MGEGAWGGSVVVAVGVSDSSPMTSDMRHVTCDIFFFFSFLSIWVLMLLSAHFKRSSVSHMQDFIFIWQDCMMYRDWLAVESSCLRIKARERIFFGCLGHTWTWKNEKAFKLCWTCSTSRTGTRHKKLL